MRYVILFFVGLLSPCHAAELGYEKTFPFSVNQSQFQVCVFDEIAARKSQTDMAHRARQFIGQEMSNPDVQVKACKGVGPTVTPEEAAQRFLDKQIGYRGTRIFIVSKLIDQQYIPVGMGKMDRISEISKFLGKEIEEALISKMGSLDKGYTVGGSVSPNYQNQGIAKECALPCCHILFEFVYNESIENNPYLYIDTLVDNEPVIRIAKKNNFEEIIPEGDKVASSKFFIYKAVL